MQAHFYPAHYVFLSCMQYPRFHQKFLVKHLTNEGNLQHMQTVIKFTSKNKMNETVLPAIFTVIKTVIFSVSQ